MVPSGFLMAMGLIPSHEMLYYLPNSCCRLPILISLLIPFFPPPEIKYK